MKQLRVPVLVAAMVIAGIFQNSAPGATWTVNSALDLPDGGFDDVCDTGNEEDGFTGLCTLRAAIQNAAPDDLIIFAGVDHIQPLTLLPPLQGSIDGGFGKVWIDGTLSSGGNGLFVGGAIDGISIENLIISGFRGHGIELFGNIGFIPTNILIRGCYIGTDFTGFDAGPGNELNGISIIGANNTTILDCVISGNGFDGIAVDIGNNGGPNEGTLIDGCFIGTDALGQSAIPNGGSGIRFGNSFFGPINNTIGSTLGNVISGNRFHGIIIPPSDFGGGDVIANNFIGTDFSGTAAIPNGRSGIFLGGEVDNITIGPNNLLSGNIQHGIHVQGRTVQDHRIIGNVIGADVSGDEPLGNGGAGVYFDNTLNNSVGGTNVTPETCDGDCNIIAYNGGAGVAVVNGGAQCSIQGNAIFGNAGLGIDNDNNGPSYNDELNDPDEGGNRLLNFPILTKVMPMEGMTLVEGVRTTSFNSPWRVEFFGNLACDASGFGEGDVFLGSLDLAFPTPTFSIMLPGEWEAVTATQTDVAGNTSEFSPCGEVFTVNSIADLPDNNPGDGVCSTGVMLMDGRLECTLRAVIQEANAFEGSQVVLFDIPGNGPHRVTIGANLPDITQPLALHASSQPGYAAGSPAVEVDGGNTVLPDRRGFNLTSGMSTIRGFSIFNFFGDGVRITGPMGENLIQANIIGLDAMSDEMLKNGGHGILIFNSADNFIGGPTADERNVISMNGQSATGGCGISIFGAASVQNQIVGNYIGTDASGNLDRGNVNGVCLDGAVETFIGGAIAGHGNVISGNGQGIRLEGSAQSTVIEGNVIGLNAGKTAKIANSRNGVQIVDAGNTFIGGPSDAPGTGLGNLISGNDFNGIEVVAGSAIIEGNVIGTNGQSALDLGNAMNGILLHSTENIVGGSDEESRNVISGNAEHGVKFVNFSNNNAVLGNFIGTGVTGTAAVPNLMYGVALTGGASSNFIGGPEDDEGNVISGNTVGGILVVSEPDSPITFSNIVQGNFIGVDESGEIALANGRGIQIENSPSNQIGGLAPDSSNIVSGNLLDGITITGANSVVNTVEGNLIGLNVPGEVMIANGGNGISILDARENVIGGAGLLGNLISGNGNHGIVIDGQGGAMQDQANNVIEGNIVGLSLLGFNLGNSVDGVRIENSSGNRIGPNNIVSSNSGKGVVIIAGDQGQSNRITQNSIFDNVGIGIDLGNDGNTTNDIGDGDGGANALMNFPAQMTVFGGAGSAVRGSIFTLPNTQVEIEFFVNNTPDPSGFGEGETFLGSTIVTTDGDGDAAFSATLLGLPLGACVTATATNLATNDTSEFSACATVENVHTGVDFGDAPEPTFETLLASDGPRHIIVAGFHLGADADAEAEGEPSEDADGDDSTGADDEDGVVFLSELAHDLSPAQIEVTASQAGRLDAWIDFDRDGNWENSEKIADNLALVAGANLIQVNVPAEARAGRAFARFRFSSEGGLAPTGLALDGEVEDYAVMVRGKSAIEETWKLFE